MQRIVLVTGNSLANNPRVQKEAVALQQAGFDVEVLGAWLDLSSKSRDEKLLGHFPVRYTAVVDWTTKHFRVFFVKNVIRARGSLARMVHRWSGIETRSQLGHTLTALAGVAASRDADMYIAHSEAGLQVGADLHKRGKRVGVDMEDWFSEDLLPEARKARPVGLLRRLENTLLLQGVHATSPSRAMSQALGCEFGCKPPIVVYNAFPWTDRQTLRVEGSDRRDRRLLSVHWYSQTIGQGRGLEDLFAALPHLARPVELHLRGHPMLGFDGWLEKQIPSGWHERVFVHPIVANEDLLSRIAEHDIGFAGEVPYCRNKDLTVSNKILHYLLGGLAVVASDTRGQREVAELARLASGDEPVLLYPSGDPLALAARIDRLLVSKERLARAKAAALVAAERTFCWERQAPALIESVQAALASAGQG